MEALVRATAWSLAIAGIAGCGLFPDLSSFDTPSDAASETKTGCGVHTFCDDFDHGPLGATWDGVLTSSGPLVLSTTNVITPPNALQATAIPDGGQSALSKTLISGDNVHIGFEVMVQAPSDTSSTQVDIVTLKMNLAPTGYQFVDFGLSRFLDATRLQQYALPNSGAAISQDILVNEAFASWRHVDFVLAFSTQKLELYIDGTLTTTLDLNPPVPKTSTFVTVGVADTVTPQADWNVFIDDFVVDVQ